MPTEPYIPRNPGDSITAEDWNALQTKIQDDIAKQVKDAVDAKTSVANADNATKLENKSANEVEDEAVAKALAVLPTRTGYKMIFKRLTTEEEKVIKHDLKACPLVDVYQLDYFEVICATGEEEGDRSDVFVNFYLYNSREQRLKLPGKTIEIEPTDGKHHPFKISFAAMLDLFGVKYTDTQSLDDLETEFWKAFFSGLNDQFDEDQYCHSPWFEKCCGEKRSVKTLKDSGAWDDIWFQMRPRKYIHFPNSVGTLITRPPGPVQLDGFALTSALADVQVVHFDFDTIGIQLLLNPTYPADIAGQLSDAANKELKVMLLLKV